MSDDANKKKRSAREKLAMLVAQSEIDDAEREIFAKSEDELTKELADSDAGVDVDAARAKLLDTLPSNVLPIRAPRRKAPAVWALYIAAAAIVVLAIGYAWRYRKPDEPIADPTLPLPKPTVSETPSADPVPRPQAVPDFAVASKPCKGRVGDARVQVSGTVSREDGATFLDLDVSLCGGPDDTGIARVALEGTGVAKLEADAHVVVQGRAFAADGGATIRVARVVPP